MMHEVCVAAWAAAVQALWHLATPGATLSTRVAPTLSPVNFMNDVDEVDEPPAVPAPSKPGPDVKPPPANSIVEDVDLATFKPTFIPSGSKPKDGEKEKQETEGFKG
ncbi:uncharacterized protein BJ212DRAFT_1299732 [Suillus subaureus]|uniref:Uncharacterized protein n=1 Tax=Suillus subaureus TaxID=48587 RepID=A0A9P7EBK2_9AGAM|nr:uncharacterized protein BJ212DRAFT_1299732 [Suillus subaureus]KAG1816474.1 hypothetical protein BJ212DRAFT_1299732 [Suillus subaureus]